MKNKKGYSYYEEFAAQSALSLQSAEMLYNILKEFSQSSIEDKIKEMHELEHSGDIVKHNMMSYLLKDFLPPIEREDIISLAQNLDTVTDCVEEILIRLDIYNVKELRPEILKFAELLIRCCKSAHTMVTEFKNFKKSSILQKEIIDLNHLEEEGDRLYASSVKYLFQTCKDPITLMIWSDIMNCFESCYDACENVADDIESIILKNS